MINIDIYSFILHTKLFNIDGKISSNARCPTVECRLSNVLAAACLTDGKGSANARLNKQINIIDFYKKKIFLKSNKQLPDCRH